MNVASLFGHAQDNRLYKPSDLLVLPACNVGIEIEVEGQIHTDRAVFSAIGKFSDKKIAQYWSVVSDGSLRDGCELVTPILFGDDLVQAIGALEKINEKLVYRPSFSHRCSTHVHLDARDLDKDQLLSLIFIYYLYEKYLFSYWGERRYNNIYCIPLNKCHQFISTVGALIRETNEGTILNTFQAINERERYCAFNLNALLKYGSVEFRHGEGTFDSKKILNWINILMCLKRYALNNPPEELLTIITDQPFADLSRDIFQDQYEILFENQDVGTIKQELLATKRRLKSIVVSSFLGKKLPRMGDEYNIMYSLYRSKKDAKMKKDLYSSINFNGQDPFIETGQVNLTDEVARAHAIYTNTSTPATINPVGIELRDEMPDDWIPQYDEDEGDRE